MSSDAYSTVARLTINTLLLYSLCRVVWVGLMHGLRAIDSVQVSNRLIVYGHFYTSLKVIHSCIDVGLL